jgi:epoxyqueuosine reductase QueG
MDRIDSTTMKRMVRDLGADLVGIAPAERFEGAPSGHSALDLMPDARSVVVAGIRIPDPIVEWQEYHLLMQEMPEAEMIDFNFEKIYMLMGHYTIDGMLNTLAVRLANRLEIDYGIRTLPTPNAMHTGLGEMKMGAMVGMFSQRHAAVRAGLGEFGFNNLVVTPQFGPRVRWVSVITRADLEPDPLLEEKVCLRGACGGDAGPKCQQRCDHGALKLREDIDLDNIFLMSPVKLIKRFCTMGPGQFGCTFIGSCLRECPIGKKATGGAAG